MQNKLNTTSWDNTNIYKNFKDEKISIDIKLIEEKIDYLKSKMSAFEDLIPLLAKKTEDELKETINLARELSRLELDIKIILYTMRTYGSTAASVDSQNADAKNLVSKAMQLSTQLHKTCTPLHLFLVRSPLSYLNNFLQDDRVSEMRASLLHEKKEEDFLMDTTAESLLAGLSVDGLHAWGKLYDEIAGNMKVNIENEQVGLASAANILFQSGNERREKAYKAINDAWKEQELSVAAILSSINGWRLESNRARSHKRELHYLDKSCHQQKMSRETLEAMMSATYQMRSVGHKSLRLMAREFKKEKMGPWDILAPYPGEQTEELVSYPDAIKLIIKAFTPFSTELAEFTEMMFQKKWIDSSPTPNRGSGAYCTGFASVREPRVFITYDGSMKNIITLAHEIGHAYHSWVMRDMKFGETFYPSTLAETASIFAETLVRNAILDNSTNNLQKKAILWQEIESAATLLINIPARFEFEKKLVELRKKKSVNAQEMKELTVEAWKHWYEDSISEYNEMFWASKMHFSISSMGFYNYPYLFGYLFSLGIYAKKDSYGSNFKNTYVDILRDTGVMSCEELILKHFKQDITKKDFWLDSIKIVSSSVDDFAKLQ